LDFSQFPQSSFALLSSYRCNFLFGPMRCKYCIRRGQSVGQIYWQHINRGLALNGSVVVCWKSKCSKGKYAHSEEVALIQLNVGSGKEVEGRWTTLHWHLCSPSVTYDLWAIVAGWNAEMLKCSNAGCWLLAASKTDENAKCCSQSLPFPSAAMPILINKKHEQLPVALCVFCLALDWEQHFCIFISFSRQLAVSSRHLNISTFRHFSQRRWLTGHRSQKASTDANVE